LRSSGSGNLKNAGLKIKQKKRNILVLEYGGSYTLYMRKNPGGEKIRSMIAAGLFYPEDPAQAETELVSLGMQSAGSGRAAAIFVPHCAWSISGRPTAQAFLRCPREGEGLSQIVLLGTIHYKKLKGVFISESDCFETPLGNIPVSRKLCGDIASCSTLFEINDIPHLQEHTHGVLLPFIKYRFPRTPLVPVLMGGNDSQLVSALARALRVIFEPVLERTLFIVPTCLSMHQEQDEAEKQAQLFLSLLTEKGGRELIKAQAQGTISACGAPLTAALLESGLFGGHKAVLASDSLLCTRELSGEFVYYAGLSLE
jgi:AmmeMemoRadiSam system protein B